MASRPQVVKFPAIVNGNMALTSITSTASIIQDLTMLSYAVSWSGTSPVGTIAVQVSNDYALNADGSAAANSGTWTTMTFSSGGSSVTSLPVSGNTGTGFIDIASTGAYAIRLVYTKGSGTGTLQAIFNAKVA